MRASVPIVGRCGPTPIAVRTRLTTIRSALRAVGGDVRPAGAPGQRAVGNELVRVAHQQLSTANSRARKAIGDSPTQAWCSAGSRRRSPTDQDWRDVARGHGSASRDASRASSTGTLNGLVT